MAHWWSQIRRLHQVAYPRGPRIARVDPATTPALGRTHRRDGWPRCPDCGADELMTTLIDLDHQPQPTDPMRCLACAWRGTVIPRERS